MAKAINYSAVTAATPIKAGTGYLQIVNITAPGDAASVVTIYDNPTAAAGTVLFQGGGGTTGSYIQTAGVSTPGVPASTGLTISIAGTTSPKVQVVYE